MPTSPTILIVDDEEVVREALCDILDLYGYATATAENAAAALTVFPRLCAEPGVHIVILDLMMPGINGIEAMRKLAEIDANARFILSSGFDRAEVLDRFNLADGDLTQVHFLQKPYTMAAVAEMVAACQAA